MITIGKFIVVKTDHNKGHSNMNNHIIIKLLTFVSIYLALMIDSARCEEDEAKEYSETFKSYVFGGSEVVTILNDVPASITYGEYEFKTKKQGFYDKAKQKLSSALSAIYGALFNREDEDTAMPYDVDITEGTYTCQNEECQRQPGDEQINYEEIKKKDGKVERPEENELTQKAAELDKRKQFVKPVNIVVNADGKELAEILDEGYKQKEKDRDLAFPRKLST